MIALRGNREPVARSGFSLVEMLVVMAIVGIILAVVVAFFSQQVGLSRRIQAENELNNRVRAVAEAIAQDFQLAGARAITDDSGRAAYVDAVRPACVENARDGCVVVDATLNEVTVAYASSLWVAPGENVKTDTTVQSRACRFVRYRLEGDTLYRADTPCDAPDEVSVVSFANLFAEDVNELTVSFVCDDGRPEPDPVDCYDDDGFGFVREGSITVNGGSTRGASPITITLSAFMPNMRPAQDFRSQ